MTPLNAPSIDAVHSVLFSANILPAARNELYLQDLKHQYLLITGKER